MEIVVNQSSEARRAAAEPQQVTTPQWPPLESVTSPAVPTAQAAYYLSRRPQTLRIWAMTGRPIKPLRVHGRLAWPMADIRRLLGMGGVQ
ncbi:hypothetical protein GCM10022279_25850 [Comamonas faecalis]|uniref:DNA-binding protein n=1 Tax=Comamonas faecalis TaxID=1387849 RepID=A0ABP7RQT4_9BURK